MRTQFVLQVDVIKRLKAVLNVLLLTTDLHAASDHWSLAINWCFTVDFIPT